MHAKILVPVALAASLVAPGLAVAQKVFINPSNQVNNAVAGGGVESTYAMANANVCQGVLTAAGFSVRVDDDFNNAPLNANSWGANVFLSVHSNAGGGHGSETLVGVPSGSQTLSDRVLAGLVGKIPYSSRGTKDGTWTYVLRTATMPGTLAEVVFHDCAATSGYAGHPPSESSYLKSASGQQAIGTGLANGICSYFNKSCTPAPQTGFVKGVVYQNADVNQHVAPATVRLSTGATTTYDGNTVWSFEVPAGTYSITASAAGYKTATRQCDAVTAGNTVWCSIQLDPDTTPKGFLKGVVYQNGLTTDHVAPATVTVNGASQTYDGNTVWSFELPVGSYSVSASASGYKAATKQCPEAVTAGGTVWCSIELTKVLAVAAVWPPADAPTIPPDIGTGDSASPAPPDPSCGEPEANADAVVDDSAVVSGSLSPTPDGACGCSSASNGVLGLAAIPLLLAGAMRRRRPRQ